MPVISAEKTYYPDPYTVRWMEGDRVRLREEVLLIALKKQRNNEELSSTERTIANI